MAEVSYLKFSDWIAVLAVVISIVGVAFTWWQWRKNNERALIAALQGEKESLAHVAYEIRRKGLPRKIELKEETIRALCFAGVFESSGRARALAYSALEEMKETDRAIAKKIVEEVTQTFKRYEEKTDLKRGFRRLNVLREILKMEKLEVPE